MNRWMQCKGIKALWLIIVVALVVLFFSKLVDLGYARLAFVFMFVLSLLATFAMARMNIARFKRIFADNPDVAGVEVARSKLAAELCGAVAIVALLSALFRGGYDLDIQNISARLGHLSSAITLSDRAVPKGYCDDGPAYGYRNHACVVLARGELDAEAALFGNDDRRLSSVIGNMRYQLKDVLKADDVVRDKADVSRAIDEFDKVLVDDSEVKQLSLVGPLIALLLGALSISRKLAVARFECWKLSPSTKWYHDIIGL